MCCILIYKSRMPKWTKKVNGKQLQAENFLFHVIYFIGFRFISAYHSLDQIKKEIKH